jgi:hypothetical protein
MSAAGISMSGNLTIDQPTLSRCGRHATCCRAHGRYIPTDIPGHRRRARERGEALNADKAISFRMSRRQACSAVFSMYRYDAYPHGLAFGKNSSSPPIL